MKKLLVGTVFARDDILQRQWLDLQLAYLKATTEDFDHITFLYGDPSPYFEQRTKLIDTTTAVSGSTAHIEGLSSLLAHFKFFKDEYENFLFIDSDAFPIRKNWQETLLSKMGDRSIAVGLRTENLETRWHASILFAKKEALSTLKFNYLKLKDLAGTPEQDVSVVRHQEELRDSVFPLIRTNQYNVHPHLCGIYYDMFYHHCCGSGRDYNMKSRWYWEHVSPVEIDVWKYTEWLMTRPNEFMETLGWCPKEYAKI